MAVMQELPKLVPDSIAAYHTDRARCQIERKKAARKLVRQSKAKKPDGVDVDVDMEQPTEQKKEGAIEAGPSTSTYKTLEFGPAPLKPEILDHLVLGINETIKSLERAIDDLKLRLMMMVDRLDGINLKPGTNLLPTAPRDSSPRSPSPEPTTGKSKEISPPAFVVIPLHSISPQSLVTPIPQYAATYNALVWQWGQLARIIKTRTKEADWVEALGEDREEVRVVPLGRVEGELAAMVGLRRLACLTINVSLPHFLACLYSRAAARVILMLILMVQRSHPNLDLLEKILPKSVLHPPRHALTLPYPTSNLKVHHGKGNSTEQTKDPAPQPHVHYAPVTIKGITTSTPIDANSKKKKRLEEVRQKRIESKARRKLEREGGKKSKNSEKPREKGSKTGNTTKKSIGHKS